MKRSSMLWFIALVGMCACHKTDKTPPLVTPPTDEAWLTTEQMEKARIVVAPVDFQPVGSSVLANGKVVFDDLRVSHVYSPVTGRITKIVAQLGQRLKRGEPLAIIESPDMGSAYSDLSKAHADFIAARREMARQEELYKVHAASQKDFDVARDAFQHTQAEFDRAQQKARLLRGSTSQHGSQEFTLRAPIEGEVIARSVNPGSEVQGLYSSGTGPELFTVGEIDSVWVMADVFEIDTSRIKKGARAIVQVVAYPNKVFEGHVNWIADVLDPISHTIKVRCNIVNHEHLLKPEMFVSVSIQDHERHALALPKNAVLRLGDQTYAFVDKGKSADGRNRFERRPVAVNEDEGGEYLPVTHGVSSGERVVTVGAILLSEIR